MKNDYSHNLTGFCIYLLGRHKAKICSRRALQQAVACERLITVQSRCSPIQCTHTIETRPFRMTDYVLTDAEYGCTAFSSHRMGESMLLQQTVEAGLRKIRSNWLAIGLPDE